MRGKTGGNGAPAILRQETRHLMRERRPALGAMTTDSTLEGIA